MVLPGVDEIRIELETDYPVERGRLGEEILEELFGCGFSALRVVED